ncbi:hypothetical protein [Streptomyces sp. BK340]|uniref:hypothetical protein n=1 Tax=Streptomyces sp. BK340 TaxID=2572903 RepID=UPI0011A04008|nr:hypothetical protein [Streptomyces sp. BK340]TVZ84884.1 hypothetical protein FB157_120151 [Streptomyces sp. BK340]
MQREVFADVLWLSAHIAEAAVHDDVITLTGQLERRSDTALAVGLTHRMDGVVDAVDHLT